MVSLRTRFVLRGILLGGLAPFFSHRRWSISWAVDRQECKKRKHGEQESGRGSIAISIGTAFLEKGHNSIRLTRSLKRSLRGSRSLRGGICAPVSCVVSRQTRKQRKKTQEVGRDSIATRTSFLDIKVAQLDTTYSDCTTSDASKMQKAVQMIDTVAKMKITSCLSRWSCE